MRAEDFTKGEHAMQVYIGFAAREYILKRSAPRTITIEMDKDICNDFGGSLKEEERCCLIVWMGKSTDYKSSQYNQQNVDGIVVYYPELLSARVQRINVKIKRVLFVKMLTAVGDE